MFLSLPHVLLVLEQYKYLLIFPIAVIEGPIITVISGLLVFMGELNIFVAYPVLVLADLVGDVLHYLIGKYWGKLSWVRKIARFLGYTDDREKNLSKHFKNHTGKILLVAKISHGVGTAIQIAAGMADVDIYAFTWFSFLGTLVKTAILLCIGYYVGSSYMKIDNYLDLIAMITVGIVGLVVLYLISKRIAKSIFKKEDLDE